MRHGRDRENRGAFSNIVLSHVRFPPSSDPPIVPADGAATERGEESSETS